MVCPPSGGSCLPFYPSVSLLVSLCWMVCPPSRGLVSPCLLSWTSGDKTSRRRTHHPNHPTKANKKGDQRRQVETRGFPSVGCCVRLPEGLASLRLPSCLPRSPIVPLLVSLCWMVCPPSGGSCLPFYPSVSLLVSLCWMVCPPSRGLVSPCLPLSPFLDKRRQNLAKADAPSKSSNKSKQEGRPAETSGD